MDFEEEIDKVISERLEEVLESLNKIKETITILHAQSSMMSYLMLVRQRIIENSHSCGKTFPVKNK